jgi:hypothetical protein
VGTELGRTRACELLLAGVRAHAQAIGRQEAFAWLERALPAEGGALDRSAFFARYAGIARRLVVANVPASVPADSEIVRALSAIGVAEPQLWSPADAARCALLLAAFAALPDVEQVVLATEVFRRGETNERVSLLRALSLLPEPARFAPLAAEACRSHVLDVLAALGCENPFPALMLAEPAFNQLVMKMVFVGLPLARMHGLASRLNAELARMAQDFGDERRAAGRPVPEDVARIAIVPAQAPEVPS